MTTQPDPQQTSTTALPTGPPSTPTSVPTGSAGGRFAGRTVVVTGASSGMGEAIARRLSAEGADVVAAARRRGRLDSLVRDLGADRTLAVTTDVTDPNDLEALMQAAVGRFGRLDVLVSNAGSAVAKTLQDTTAEDWDQMMSLNARSAFLGARAAAPHLRASGGNIVQITSVTALGGRRTFAAYDSAKAAVTNLTRSLAFDLGADGIRVNAVAPSLTMPAETAAQEPYSGWVAGVAARQAMSGHATPDDIAAAVSFLASADARFITGTTLAVDGGVSATSGFPDLF